MIRKFLLIKAVAFKVKELIEKELLDNKSIKTETISKQASHVGHSIGLFRNLSMLFEDK
jgi:hypothetical protein